MSAIPVLLIQQKKCTRLFKNLAAVTPATAIIPEENGIRTGLAFNRLVRHGIIIPAGNDRFYLDVQKDAAARKQRVTFIIFILIAIIAALLAGVIRFI